MIRLANPPFKLDPERIGRMNDRQLYGLFALKRHEDGTPDLPDPLAGDAPTAESVYRRHLWLNGITDRAEQTRLWNEERTRRGRRTPVQDFDDCFGASPAAAS